MRTSPHARHSPDDCTTLAAAIGGFDLVFAVPGAPVSHLADFLATRPEGVIWSVNEKTAIEQAVGASLVGKSACVVMKHNGLGFALDSLTNAATHTIGAPMLVVVGDDPDATSSTSNVDSRAIARAAGVPMLSPTLDGDVARIVTTAAASSARHGIPFAVRITPRLHSACASPAAPPVWAKAPSEAWTARPQTSHGLTKSSRIDRRDRELALLGAELDEAALDSVECVEPHSATLVVCVGDTAQLAPHDTCRVLVTTAHPTLGLFAAIDAHPAGVIVLEEGLPLIEQELRARGLTVRGRVTEHLPRRAALTADDARAALDGTALAARPLEDRGLQDEDPLLHELYHAIAQHRSQGTFVATDVGTAIRLAYPPYDGADAALALGSSVAVAAGAARSGRPAIAIIGDYGLLHSGLETVLEAANEQLNLTIVLVDNGVQAKTGGQPVTAVDAEAALRGLGVERVTRMAPTLARDEYLDHLSASLQSAGPSLLIVNSRDHA